MRKIPTEQKLLTGTYRPERDRPHGRLTYPVVTDSDLKAPRHLSKHGKSLWNKVAPLIAEQSILKTVDLELLELYCESYAGYRDSLDDIKTNGRILVARAETKTGFSEKRYRNPATEELRKYAATMRDCSAKFGLSPLDRKRIEGSVPTKQDDDDSAYDDFPPYDPNIDYTEAE